MELADVSAHPAGDGRWTLVFTRDLRHPPEKVWAALTEPGRLKEWAPFEPSRDLGEPGDATLVMDGAGTDETVTKADRPHLLEYTWGGDLLRWELEPTETGTRLRLSHTIFFFCRARIGQPATRPAGTSASTPPTCFWPAPHGPRRRRRRPGPRLAGPGRRLRGEVVLSGNVDAAALSRAREAGEATERNRPGPAGRAAHRGRRKPEAPVSAERAPGPLTLEGAADG